MAASIIIKLWWFAPTIASILSALVLRESLTWEELKEERLKCICRSLMKSLSG